MTPPINRPVAAADDQDTVEMGPAPMSAYPTTRGVEEVLVVPVVAESLEVGTEVRETGRVRVTKHVHERTETVDLPLERTEVHVEKVPVGRPIEGTLPVPRYEGDVLVVPIVEEVIHVEKRLVLKEEWRIGRVTVPYRNPQEVTIRSEEIEVQRVAVADDSAGPQKANEI